MQKNTLEFLKKSIWRRKMSRVERAIIMAAGIGDRMKPITDTTPKPLVKVNGVRIIDTVIDGLHKNGIKEIYIVVGHLKEKFLELNDEYSNLVFIYNPYYKTTNNVSSLYLARDYIENSIILDGDQIIYNDKILEPNFNISGYNAVWCEDYTDEWLMTVEDGIVKKCSRDGGSNGWQLYSISRWDSKDAKKLKKHLEVEIEEKNNTSIYWDDIPMFCYPSEYTLGIKKMNREDVIEIDSIDELKKIDNNYCGGSY